MEAKGQVTIVETMDGRDALRNVLVGSDLRNKDMPELVVNSNDEGENIVEVSSTELCDGTPSLHVKVGNNGNYPGMFFSPVAIKRSTTYHLSVMAKGKGTLDFEVVNKLSAASRGIDRDGWLSPQPARSSIDSDGWTLHECTFTTDSAHDYVEVGLHGNVKGDEFWLARPMLEEGTACTGWTLNAEDLRGEKGDKGDPGGRGADAVTYEIDPIREQAAVSIEKAGDTDENIQVTGSLSVDCRYAVYRKTGGVREAAPLQDASISAAVFNDGSAAGLRISGLSVTGSGIGYSSTDGRAAIIITFALGGETIGVRTVPVGFAPASLIKADQEQWTQMYANGRNISALQQDAESIHLKVDRLPTRNLMDMGSVGEIAVKGDNVVWGPKEVAVTAGRKYTVTWKGRVENAVAHIKFYVYVDSADWGNSSGPYSSTADGFFRHVFTPAGSGLMKVYVQYVDKDNADPGTYPYKVFTDWVRVDEGDHAAREADRLTAWEPTEADTEALNLLPDHLLEGQKAYSDAMGSRDIVNKQQQDVSRIVGKGSSPDGVAYVRFTRSGVYGNKAYDAWGNTVYDGGEIFDGLQWYVPFRGAGDYTISVSMKNMRGNTASEDNCIGLELLPCAQDKTRLNKADKRRACELYESDKNGYGWKHIEKTVTINATERDADGTAREVRFLEVRLYMTEDGDMAASRLCLSKCSHGTVYDAQELSAERQDEAAQLATGIDIYQRRIMVTADNTTFRTNDGKEVAVFDEDGLNATLINTRKLTIRSLDASKDDVTATIADGMLSFLKGNAGVRIGLDDNGIPCVEGYDTAGKLIWRLGQNYLEKSQDLLVKISVESVRVRYSVYNSTPSRQAYIAEMSLSVENTSNTPVTLSANNISATAVTVDGVSIPLSGPAEGVDIATGETGVSMPSRASG